MNDRNSQLLHRIENNDTLLTTLQIGSYTMDPSDNAEDFVRLGAAVATNTRLSSLMVDVTGNWYTVPREFFDGLRRNTSINKLEMYCSYEYNIGSGSLYEILVACQEKLTELFIDNAHLENGGHQTLMNLLRRCTELRIIALQYGNTTGEQLLPMVDAIRGNNMLLRSLRHLDIRNNRIGNEGCQALATLLMDPNTRLNHLDLTDNGIGIEGVIAFANSLANNTILKKLYLANNTFDTKVAHNAFINVLCNATSINDTYASNHTLDRISLGPSNPRQHDLTLLLAMNRGKNRSLVPFRKILQYHPNIDMSPLFELEEGEQNLKSLPYVVALFEKIMEARVSIYHDTLSLENRNFEERKLSAIYQFAQAMPLLFVPASHIRGVGKKRKRND